MLCDSSFCYNDILPAGQTLLLKISFLDSQQHTDEVVMASGSFTQGSTIELSCDGPLRAPYTCYLQGGLNFAASRAGVLLAVQKAYFKE